MKSLRLFSQRSLWLLVRCGSVFLFGFGLLVACQFDDSLREYLDVHFWLPFAKRTPAFEKKNVRRMSAPFAGMGEVSGGSLLEKARAAYRATGARQPGVSESQREAISAARADSSLTAKDREEVDLIEIKIEMRAAEPDDVDLGNPVSPEMAQRLQEVQTKFQAFLRTAKTPEFQSEAQGWVAHIYYMLGDQTAAGKIYLDELNRQGSNISRESLLTSLRITYGYDGGSKLIEHLDEYFDTPEHAAFAIQLTTNPHWNRDAREDGRALPAKPPNVYPRILTLLQKHSGLFKSTSGAETLAQLSIRTSLRMGDVNGAIQIANMVPANSPARDNPDFEWMLASAQFLSKDYPKAEQTLLQLFGSKSAPPAHKAAAAYGLCGVYLKTKNQVEQIHFALWLRSAERDPQRNPDFVTISDQSIYWAESGWDLATVLDVDSSTQQLKAFLDKYPTAKNARLVKYALAVQLTRENRYDEAADLYQSIQANRRAPRMRQLAALYKAASQTATPVPQLHQAQFQLAEFLIANDTGIYFNDSVWSGLQRYALEKYDQPRVTREERQAGVENKRKLQDDQEERWRAYLILRDLVRDEGKTDLGRQAARLALRALRGISVERFGRKEEIRQADISLSKWLRG